MFHMGNKRKGLQKSCEPFLMENFKRKGNRDEELHNGKSKGTACRFLFWCTVNHVFLRKDQIK